jgi:transposase InsO family protein
MGERMSFIVDSQRGEMSFAALCRYYGVSRETGYKWIGRYAADGIDGLKDRSRAPHHHPHAVSAADAAAIVAMRLAQPSWGPKKILARLRVTQPERAWPVESTIAALLDRRGLVKHRRRRRTVPSGSPLSACAAANDVWGIDFKGWFRTGDGRRCDPLSVSDLATRYVVRLQAFERIDGEEVWPVLDAAFREYGPPLVMRSDNGAPFASTAAGGLSRLAVRLIKAGIRPERITPGRPQQNGRHERMHLTLKAETASPPAATLRLQQRRFDAFRRVFNEERPHEALGQTPPVQHYHPPPRSYGGRLREPDYPDGTEVRRVRLKGEIKWRGTRVFVSRVLVGEPVGLEPVDDGHWRVHYGPVTLGLLDPAGRFETRKSPWGPACGFVDSAEEALPTTPQAPPPQQAE